MALSYLLGVLLKGDGTVYITNESKPLAKGPKRYLVYKVELKNTSSGFLKAFNIACSQVLARRQIQIMGPNKDGHRTIRYCSKDFVLWWRKQSLKTLRRFIEAFPVQYLRGRFDSDGNVRKYGASLVGIEPHRRLMEFERTICMNLGMRAGQIRRCSTPGNVTFIGSKRVVTKQQSITFSVNTADLREHIQFLNVERRNIALQGAKRIRKWTPWPIGVRKEIVRLARETCLDATTIRSRLQGALGVDVLRSTLNSWLRGTTQSWQSYARKFDA